MTGKGLAGDETVVINGIQMARPGRKVEPAQGRISLTSDHCLAMQRKELSHRTLSREIDDTPTRKN